MNSKLRKTFLSLADAEDPQSRGIEFQDLLRQVLVESRFEVHQNPRVAKPRQSDLLATKDDLVFLIEAKWLTRKIDASDIDDLRARLQRTPVNVIGCLISMSEFAPTAVEAVEADRQREILLFRPGEVESLTLGKTVDELIKRKRKTFRIDGKVWFAGEKDKRVHGSRFPFPPSQRSLCASGFTGSSFFCRASNTDTVFTPHTLDFTWGTSAKGVELSLTPELETTADLREFLALLHNQLGLSDEGTFAISQTGCNWHGVGIQDFLKEAERWRERYNECNLDRPHHSEDLHYFGKCHTGLLLLTARQGVGGAKTEHLHSCRLEIRLPGIPVDMRPFANVCEKVRETLPFFSILDESQSESVDLRNGESLDVLGEVVSSFEAGRDEDAVCGLLVKNPFFNRKSAIPQGQMKWSPFQFLDAPEYFVCDMSDWHDVGDVIDHYRLKRLEAMQMGGVVVVHPVCTWDNILKKQRGFRKASPEKLRQITIDLARFYGAKLSPSAKRQLKQRRRQK